MSSLRTSALALAILIVAPTPWAAAQVTLTSVDGDVNATVDPGGQGVRSDRKDVRAPGSFQVFMERSGTFGLTTGTAEGTVVVLADASGATISSTGSAQVSGSDIQIVRARYSATVNIRFSITEPVSYTVILDDNSDSSARTVGLGGGGSYSQGASDPFPSDFLPREGTLQPGEIVFSFPRTATYRTVSHPRLSWPRRI